MTQKDDIDVMQSEVRDIGKATYHSAKEIKRLSECVDECRRDRDGIRIKVARIETKSGMWGALGGIITVALALLVAWAKTILAK